MSSALFFKRVLKTAKSEASVITNLAMRNSGFVLLLAKYDAKFSSLFY